MAERAFPEFYPGWETVRKLGSGSFGTVYEIQRNLFGRVEKAALKVITIPQNEGDIEELYSSGYDEESVTAHFKSYLADIVREYSLMAEMKGHTNVVYCDDIRYIQHDDGIGWDIFIKMELLTPLLKMLGKTVSEAEVLRLGRDLCQALVLCKGKNIVHRDIKPQNIFVSESGDYKLGDFGIAKTVERTSGGTKIGTYSYMAPEVYNNQPYGSAADIYSLGLVLYWLLNERRLPFLPIPPAMPTSSDNETARLRRFQGEAIPAPKNGSRELKRIVMKACEYDPKDRYESAAEMLAELEALQSGKPVPAPAPEKAAEPAPEREEATATIGVWTKPTRPGAVPEEPTESTVGVWDPPKQKEPAVKNSQAPKPKKKAGRGLWIGGAAVLVALMVLLIPLLKKAPAAPTSSITLHAAAIPTATPFDPDRPAFADWTNVAAIRGSDSSFAALRSDGTVLLERNTEDEYACPPPMDTSSWRNIVKLAGDGRIWVGLTGNGRVVFTGGYEDTDLSEASSWENMVDVDADGSFIVGVGRDGHVRYTGFDYAYYNLDELPDWTGVNTIEIASCLDGGIVLGMRKDGTLLNDNNQYTEVTSNLWITTGIRPDGTVNFWGSDEECFAEDMPSWHDMKQIAVGDIKAVGLQTNGKLVFSGYCGPLTAAESWTDICRIVFYDDQYDENGADCAYLIGIRNDGTVACLGSHSFDTSAWTDVVDVVMYGHKYLIGLRSDGTLLYAERSDVLNWNMSDYY